MSDTDGQAPAEGAAMSVEDVVALRQTRREQQSAASGSEEASNGGAEDNQDGQTGSNGADSAHDGDPQDEGGAGEGEEGAGEGQQASAVEAPHFWSADAKARFAELPPELQAFVAEQAKNGERVVTQATMKASEAAKLAEAEAASITQMRGTIDSVLAQAQQVFVSKWGNINDIDWIAWAKEDAEGCLSARLQLEEEQKQLQRLQAVQHATANRQQEQFAVTEADRLRSIASEPAHPAHAAAAELTDPEKGPERARALQSFLLDTGIAADHLVGLDSNVLALAYDAMRWRQGRAQAASRPKQQPAPASPGLKPSAQQPRTDSNRTLDALKAKAAKTGDVEDVLAYRRARNQRKSG